MEKNKQTGRSVRDVMTANPECISEKDTIRDAARIMAKQDTGVVPVVNGKKVVGMITDRDIVIRVIAEGKDCSAAKAADAMSKGVKTVREDASVDDALKLMSSSQVRRIPVVNANDELVGIVSMGDISKTDQDNKVGRVIETISEAPPNK
ncbi:MAG: CBS domain-containing protein [Thermoanaerobaculia bacterium]